MKQLVFRIFDPKIPIIQVILGNLVDNEFKTETGDLQSQLNSVLGSGFCFVRFDDYFNNTPFIKASDFSKIFPYAMRHVDNIEFFPGFLVLTLNPNCYGTSKKEE